jgi:hypothetical protein
VCAGERAHRGRDESRRPIAHRHAPDPRRIRHSSNGPLDERLARASGHDRLFTSKHPTLLLARRQPVGAPPARLATEATLPTRAVGRQWPFGPDLPSPFYDQDVDLSQYPGEENLNLPPRYSLLIREHTDDRGVLKYLPPGYEEAIRMPATPGSYGTIAASVGEKLMAEMDALFAAKRPELVSEFRRYVPSQHDLNTARSSRRWNELNRQRTERLDRREDILRDFSDKLGQLRPRIRADRMIAAYPPMRVDLVNRFHYLADFYNGFLDRYERSSRR